MLDIKLIREKTKEIRQNLARRQLPEILTWFDEVVKLDSEIRRIKGELDEQRHDRNVISEQINEAKKKGGDAKKIIEKAKQLPAAIKANEELLDRHEQRIRQLLLKIPNTIDKSVPYGKTSEDNITIKKVGTPKKPKYPLLSNGELIEKLNIGDFNRAAKIAGTGFYFLKGKLALLDLSLQRFAIDYLVKKGFNLHVTPMLMNRKAYEGVTSLDDFENVMYKIQDDEMYMIATSEHPLMAQYKDEVLSEKELPIKMCGISSCFRREIGSHGVDTRGIFRVHQFAKVEETAITLPEDSADTLEEMQKCSETIFKTLGIPFRVVRICTGDMGIIAAKKYDIEAWSPRQNKYFEVTSASNCETYQAVRLNIRFERDGKREYAHTLNNTGIATCRAMVAILENFQTKDGHVKIPRALQKYTGFKEI